VTSSMREEIAAPEASPRDTSVAAALRRGDQVRDLDAAAPLFDEVYGRWAAVEGAPHLRALGEVKLAWADLPDGQLTTYFDGTITLDDDPAKHGWFVDATPADDLVSRAEGGAAGERRQRGAGSASTGARCEAALKNGPSTTSCI